MSFPTACGPLGGGPTYRNLVEVARCRLIVYFGHDHKISKLGTTIKAVAVQDPRLRRDDIKAGRKDIKAGRKDFKAGGKDVKAGGKDVKAGGKDAKVAAS